MHARQHSPTSTPWLGGDRELPVEKEYSSPYAWNPLQKDMPSKDLVTVTGAALSLPAECFPGPVAGILQAKPDQSSLLDLSQRPPQFF